MIRVLVNGAHGKMGQETVQAIEADAELMLVGQTGRQDDLAAQIKTTQAQVIVDFTEPSTVFQTTQMIIEAGAHPVIGTSGLTAEQIQILQQRCQTQQLGGIIAPNFALGAILMMRFAKMAAEYYPHVEIIEMHHENKKDKPSGTAAKTAQMLNETIATHPNIPIHSIRLPGIVAVQEVLFGGQSETLSIKHQSIHRASFMPGVLLACKKVISLNELVYGLEHLC